MNRLFDALPKDEQQEEEMIYSIGDSLLNQFYCGNWSSSVEEMVDNNYSVHNLLEYVEYQDDKDGEFSGGCFGGWFDRSFFAELASSQVNIN